jgi:antitoxin (DNA-binding transcriptional repressor) of toxin-antitoxin stability system
MSTVTIQEAQAKLPDLIRQLAPGAEVVTTDNNRIRQERLAARTLKPRRAVIPAHRVTAVGTSDLSSFLFRPEDGHIFVVELKRDEAGGGAERGIGVPVAQDPTPIMRL